jgi:nucleoside-diphosphate-sugar epimerase
MDRNAKIYVAGHQGMVGSAVCRALGERGYRNLVTVPLEELDLRRQAETEAFFAAERPAVVFLAAARVGGILANASAPADFLYDNVMIAANVIHAAWRCGTAKLINFGSSCIYPRLAPQPLREEYLLTGELEPTNEAYAVAKIAALKLCRHFNAQYGTDFFSLMPTNLYGPGDNYDLASSHVLPALIRKFRLARLLRAGDLAGLRRDLARRPLAVARDAVPRGDETAKRRNGETATGEEFTTEAQSTQRDRQAEHRTSNTGPKSEVRGPMSADPEKNHEPHEIHELVPNPQSAIRNQGINHEPHEIHELVPNPQSAIRNLQLSDIAAACAEYGITAEAVTLWGTGTPRREFLHVDDLAVAAVHLMERGSWREVGDFVNVGWGEDLPIRDLAEMVRAEVGFEGEIRFDPDRPDGTPRKLLDVSRIRALGWVPRIPLADGIARTVREYTASTA